MPLPQRRLQSQLHSGSRIHGVTLALSGSPNLRPKSDHHYSMLLLFRQPSMSKNFKIHLQPPSAMVVQKLNCNLFSHHERLAFFSASATSNNLQFFSCCHQVIAQWMEAPSQWFLHSTCSTKYAAKILITLYFHISMQYKLIIGRPGACHGISIETFYFMGGSAACS